MAKLDELRNAFSPEDAPDVDMATMPDEISGTKPAPYPGRYTFQLPPEFNFEPFEAEKGEEGQRKKVKRLRVVFDDSHPLTIVRASALNLDWIGHAVKIRVSNNEYPSGDDKLMVSELGFLLKKGLGEILPAKAGNFEYAQAIASHANQKFDADVEWSAFCDTTRKRYVYDETQQRNVEDPEHMGCGQRWAQNAFTKKDGTHTKQIRLEVVEIDGVAQQRFAETFVCDCGAALRCFPKLRNYGTAPQE